MKKTIIFTLLVFTLIASLFTICSFAQDNVEFTYFIQGDSLVKYAPKDTAVINGVKNFSGGALTIPDEIDGTKVGGLTPELMKDSTSLTDLTLPADIMIGGSAFQGCTALKNITFNGKLLYIGTSAFYGCTALETLDLPLTDKMDSSAFCDCTGLKSVNVRGNIGFAGFSGCTALTDVFFPENANCRIGGWAFHNCTALTELDLRNCSVPYSKGYNAFSGCTALERVYVGKMTEYMFEDCSALNEVYFSEAAGADIPEGMFSGCASLEHIYIPEGIRSIGNNAFAKSALTEIVIPQSVTAVNYDAFAKCQKLETVVFPSDLGLTYGDPLGDMNDENNTIKGLYVKGSRSDLDRFIQLNKYTNFKWIWRLRPTMPFSDVSIKHENGSAIEFCYRYDMMVGTSDITFSPKMPLTRAMFITVLSHIAGGDVSGYTEMKFADVAADKWYAPYVEWAYENGYTAGVGKNADGRPIFDPDGIVTREQLSQFLYRYTLNHGVPTENSASLNAYSDAASVSAWAVDAVKWSLGNNIVSAADSLISPKKDAVRADMANAVYRFCKNVAKLNIN